ncbi:UNVERIFIED_ORG: FMN phosphatase YigB (HAD superfamily) [Rhizobium esperanzae]
MKGTALMVGGGGLQGLPVLRAAKAAGWRAIVADSISDNINRYEADKYFVAPPVADLPGFTTFLRDLISKENIQAIFPTTMYDLPVLAELRPALEVLGVQVYASSPALVAILQDKKLTTDEAGGTLPMLPSVQPEQHDFSYPLIGKPRRGWGGLDILHLDDQRQFEHAVTHYSLDDYLWQRRITDFREWSVDFAIRPDGSVSPLVERLRVRSSGGYAVISDIVRGVGPTNAAMETANWLASKGGVGLFNIQFLEDEDRFWLTDINPRPGTSSVSALAAGANLVYYLLSEARPQYSTSEGILVRTLNETFIEKSICGAKGVIFDLDETIIDQKLWMLRKLTMMIESTAHLLGNKVSSFRNAAVQIIDEGPWDRLIDVALARANVLGGVAPDLIAAWRLAWPESISVHSDAQGLAEDIVQKGIPFAIVTDNPAFSQQQKLRRLPAPWSSATAILTDELNAAKPDPAGFLLAAEKLEVPVDDLIFIGDSPWRDALGALRAGYRGAVIVQRDGAMHNARRQLFEQYYPEFAQRVSWVKSLAGLGHLVKRAA